MTSAARYRTARLAAGLVTSIAVFAVCGAQAQSVSSAGNPTVLDAVKGVQSSVSDLAAMLEGLEISVAGLQASAAWDKTISGASRFVVLANMRSEAVLDLETALVWEKSPATTSDTWYNSLDACARRATGGRKGWRLPSVHELASLVDPTSAASPALPSGNPFSNVQPVAYYSASIRVGSAPWVVNFGTGSVDFVPGTDTTRLAWCVRGGQNHAKDY